MDGNSDDTDTQTVSTNTGEDDDDIRSGLTEVYKQKYETFRHHDRIRWQLIQLAMLVSTGILVFDDKVESNTWPSVFSRLAVGCFLLFVVVFLIQLLQISAENSRALDAIAKRLGDRAIPRSAQLWKRITFWVAFFFGLLAIASIGSTLLV